MEQKVKVNRGVTTIDSTEERIIRLLSKNIGISIIADMVGVTPGYISQIAADNSDRVSAIKYDTLLEASNRDDRINALEDRSIGIVEDKLKLLEDNPYAMKNPLDAVRMLTAINSLKRRGFSGDIDGNVNNSNTVINVVLPFHIVNKYAAAMSGEGLETESLVIDALNNVRVAGDQELVTMPSGTLKGKLPGVKSHDNISRKERVQLSWD